MRQDVDVADVASDRATSRPARSFEHRSEAKWTVLIGQYWQCAWLRSADDAEVAAAEMRSVFHRKLPTNDEVCRAIRWLAGPENRQEKSPTLRELIRAIWIMRKQDRTDDSAPAEKCQLCDSGWLQTWHGWSEAGPRWTYADFMAAYVGRIPCTCDAGNHAVAMCVPYKGYSEERRDRLGALRRAAVKQNAEFRILRAEAVAAVKDESGDDAVASIVHGDAWEA